MYIFTKEIKAQVNEQANGILREGRRTERGENTHTDGIVVVVIIVVVKYLLFW